MKKIQLFTLLLALNLTCLEAMAQSEYVFRGYPAPTRRPQMGTIITIPPGNQNPNHTEALAQLSSWARAHRIKLTLDLSREIDYPALGGNAFYALRLTRAQIANLRAAFPQFWIERDRFVVPVSGEDEDEDEDEPTPAGPDTNFTWAINNIFNRTFIYLPGPQLSAPVTYYVLGTGVQRKVGSSGTLSHPEFPPSAGIQFVQGLSAPGLNATWPPATGAWSIPAGDPIPLELPLFTGSSSLQGVDPFRDAVNHETGVASTAVAATCGVLSAFSGSDKVNLFPVKIYQGSSTATPVSVAVAGIYATLDHHSRSGGPAVMSFAHRTAGSASYSASLELALYNAWEQGITVVCAAGNRRHASEPTAMSSTQSIPSWARSPARLGPGWLPNMRPDYLLIVGGSRAVRNGSLLNGWGIWSTFGTNRGPEVDIIAPFRRVAVASRVNGPSYIRLATGSSYSSGYVAGFAIYRHLIDPTATNFAVRDWILSSNVPGCPAVSSAAFKTANGQAINVPLLRWQ